MSGRGIVEAETWRTQQIEAEERSSDPPNAAVGDWWVRIDIKPSIDTDNVNTLGALRIQGSGGVLQVPLVNSSDSPYLGEDVYIGPQFQFGTYANDGISGSSVGFVPVTDQGGAKGSPRAVSPTGVVYEAHDDVELSAIPDSVIYQHRVEDFASPWPANIGTSSGTIINGTSTTTFSNGESAVEGEGPDDGVTTDGPEQLPTNTTFGIALTAQFTSTSNDIFGAVDGSDGVADFRLSGNLKFIVRDRVNGNVLDVNTGADGFADGNPHAIVLNKRSDDANDIEIYVDDMSTDISSVDTNDSFSTSDYANAGSMGYFARADDNGDLGRYRNVKAGVFEWNTEPYSQSERDKFVSRRPEV